MLDRPVALARGGIIRRAAGVTECARVLGGPLGHEDAAAREDVEHKGRE
jgi:hypothetical protein